MKSVALHNLGCKVNGYELDVIQQMLQEKGYKIVSFDEKADIYIVNTCTVTNIADRKSRQMLHKAKKRNPNAIVVAAGCYVQTGKEDIMKDVGVDLLVGNNKKKELVSILEAYLQAKDEAVSFDVDAARTLNDTTVIDIGSTKEFEQMHLSQTADHTRAYIKIQDGCNQFCAYCIIPYARGRVRSKSMEDVLCEIKDLVENGYKEVVLTGIHISSYGVDFGERSLLSLIRLIHAITGIQRIRIGSLEPRIITEDFVLGLKQLPKVCPHFHLSLQSGCDDTLTRMNRKYTSGEYYEKVVLLRSIYDNPAITTDVIVGFPGETQEEFETTRKFLEHCGLFEMHIFKYSKRKGTPAAEMQHQIPDVEKSNRSNILLAMEKNFSKDYREHYIGEEVEVLFEETKQIDGSNYQVGRTMEYVKVAIKTEDNYGNLIIPCIVSGLLTDDILLAEQK